MKFPNKSRRQALATLTSGAAAVALPALTWAQTWPTRPVNVVIPYPVGGTTDVIARTLQPAMQSQLGQPIVVDAKTGASGMIATRFVARAPADGYTVLLQTNGIVITPHIIKSAGINPIRDFEPVTLLAAQPMVLVTNPSLPVRSIKELLDYAKAHPGQIDFGSSGAASNGRLATEQFMRQAGISMNHVPYKGMAPITQALLSGEVKLMLSSTTPQINEFVKAGKLRYLGVASLEPSELVPNVEPIAKTLKGFQAEVWYGLLVPRGTPREVVARINDAALKALAVPENRKIIESAGAAAEGSTPEAFKSRMEREYKAWGEIVAQVGVTED
ncbi:Bug family tripartite tricarboxylate transporter substrate binding protein [Rhodoferax sediminis]|uniref:Tripartite tricarboxylate transporter substrate binding protein n=1 Tax=Rhodoferax sediminis TaxID=2509614 RepID=A0A515DDY4_9BURK|nr:tripartite tricarboxylate transporter substrate binding protein [Rhodoferax sediminis]QDL38607.1 tripartite tricarboxylate transporter substrate binding protein [Rhodoferax sediminis]